MQADNSKNHTELDRIDSEEHTFKAKYSGECSAKDKLCLDEFKVKEGARVVMTVNAEGSDEYCNGSLGTVVKISKDAKGSFIEVRIDESGMLSIVYPHKFAKYKYKMEKKDFPKLDREGNPVIDRKTGQPKTEKRMVLEKEETGSVTQFPMKLGYAITIER